MEKAQNKTIINTPYDDVFRTLIVKCPQLVILFINEVFHEAHSVDETLCNGANEHFANQQDGAQTERITDSCFWFEDRPEKRYPIECQSTRDHTIMIRMYEYDSQIALENSALEGSTLTVRFPDSAVLFLRDSGLQAEEITVRIETPGGVVSYRIPAVKIRSYTLEQIFQKRLLLLLPFYIFRYEKKFGEMGAGKETIAVMLQDFSRIQVYLTEEAEAGRLDAYEKRVLIEMTEKVVENITRKYETVKKGVGEVMGGKVLELEIDRAYDRGWTKGLIEGQQKGRLEGELNNLVKNIRLFTQKSNGTFEQAMDFFEVPGSDREELRKRLE